MELSIVITSYKNPELLRLCIGSIRKNIAISDYEIIVVDSATEEVTEVLMREEFPEIKFFSFKKNVGFQALIRKGLENCGGNYILMLNGDIIVTDGSIEKMLNFIKTDSTIGLTGPQLLNFNGSMQESCFRFYKPLTIIYRRTFLKNFGFAKKHLGWFLMKDYDHKNPKEVDWLMGSALLVSREAIKKVGLMDPRFFMYMEDVDWCRRFWENGYKVVYFPDSKMHHYHSRGSAKGGFFQSLFFNKLTWIHIYSAMKYFLKYLGKPLPQHE